jgi:hypothetical protein
MLGCNHRGKFMNKTTSGPIVCRTDFSEAAAKAANVATAMAMRLGAPSKVVHGIDEQGEIPARYWPPMMEAPRSQLHAEAGRVRRSGAQVEEVMAGGTPEDGVATTAERVGTRVLQAIFNFDRGDLPIFVGQQMDVFIDAGQASTISVRTAALKP